MNILPPTVRHNRRYLLILGTRSSIERAIIEGIGAIGWGKTSPVFVSEKNGETVLCVNREMLTSVRASLAIFKEDLKVLRVSGTLKGLGK